MDDYTTAPAKPSADLSRAASTPETAAKPLTTQEDWLQSLRSELEQREAIGCPWCGGAVTPESLQSSICSACHKPFFQESRMAPGLRRSLWLLVLFVVIAAVVVAIVVALGGVGIAGALASGSDRSTQILVLLVAAAAFIGLVSLVARSGSDVLRYFSPKSGPQRTLAKLAKQSRKSGNLPKAARFYAELLTYGYSDNFYTDTQPAYSSWKELGDQAQRLAFNAEYRDLLFYERYLRHFRLRKRGSDYLRAAESSLKELVEVASDSPRLPVLSDMYYGDSSNSYVADAVRQRYPRLAEAFGGTKKLTFPFFKTLASPTIPDREPATKPRENQGPCCRCGKVDNCWGLDVYAAFAFGTKTAALGVTYYCHYLGYYELRLCAPCLRRLDGTAADLWKTDSKALGILISRYLQGVRGYLVAGCPFELAGQWRVLEPRIEPREVVRCEPQHLRFLIEPPREEAKYGDLNGVKWNWLLAAEYKKCIPPGEWYPSVRHLS